jgi:FkbH-like protein
MPSQSLAPDSAVAVAATFTIEPLVPPLRLLLGEAGLSRDVKCAPYNQVFQELLSASSLLATNSGGANVILIRMEDFVRELTDITEAWDLIQGTTRELSDALSQHARRALSPTLLGVLASSPRVVGDLREDLDAAAASLMEHALTLPGIYLLTANEIERVCDGQRYDPLRDELAHIPFTDGFYASIALAIARKVHAIEVPAHKVLVLDCDNTLWRGVVGEDGVTGIALPPGFLRVQRYAIEQQEKGILICLASKNSERDVLDVFEQRPDMQLKSEHIISRRIDWNLKSDNISSMARELNLGLDSFVFIDDNPIECAQMRAALPQVVTLQLPSESQIERFLGNLWMFDKIAVTGEDKRRTSLYRENAARQQLEESTADIADFVASLDLVIDISDPKNDEWPRVAQLTQRTNQFNFTTVRRTEPDLRALQAGGALVWRVNVKDRFGDYGLVGEIVANAQGTDLVVDTLLLSCRVLGRGVEHAMLRRLGEIAEERGLTHVNLRYLPTPKNEPARAFAESVAAEFRLEEQNQIHYRIPVGFAGGVFHRPGHDPEAVINARKSEEKKATAVNSRSDASPLLNRSERYSRLALQYTSGKALLDAVHTKSVRARGLPGPPEKPATDTEQKLAVLWQELLNVDELGVEDDYFALGGTSLLAVRMFAEIAERFGVKLRLTAILDSPTVRALARYVEPQRTERSGVLIELKRGAVRNLFLVHDGDGETLLYRNLARRMPENLAVLGIEPRRVPGVALAHTRIEEMARFYVEEIRKRQPTGPYMLGGLCAGGVIAYEMASQLRSAGDSVELVAILDAAKPHAQKRSGRLAEQRAERLEQMFEHARGQQETSIGRAFALTKAASGKLRTFLAWQITSRAKQLSTRVRFRLLHELLGRGLTWPTFLRELSVREIYDSAEARYFPKALSDVGVLLVRAESDQLNDIGDTPHREIYADDRFGWNSICPHIDVVDVAGGHSSMLQEPFVESLASALTAKLNHGTAPASKNAPSVAPLATVSAYARPASSDSRGLLR